MRAKTDHTPSQKQSSLLNNPYAAAKGITALGASSNDDATHRSVQPLDKLLQVADSSISLSDLASQLSEALLSHVMKQQETYLTDKEVAARYSLSKQTIWRWTAERPAFPKPIKFENGTTRWRMSQLIAYEAAIMGAQE